MADLDFPLSVELDLSLSRRQRVHAILDSEGRVIHHEVRMSAVFAWLCDEDQHKIVMVDGDDRFNVLVTRAAKAPAQ